LTTIEPTAERSVPADPGPFRSVLGEGPRSLSPTRRALHDWLLAAGADEDWIHEVLVAASEACTNALEHAYAGGAPGVVELQATMTAGSVEVVIADSGVWKEPLDRGNRGRGRDLMEHLMDRAVIESGPDGTVVRLHKGLPIGAQPTRPAPPNPKG
jgi:anti-sigma regulatory factor (Ser/Thr protein kinase)